MLSRRECLGAVASAWASAGAPRRARSEFPAAISAIPQLAFRSPGPQPNGLQAAEEGLWIVDQKTNRASLVRYEDSGVLREIDTAADGPSGITWDGSALWVASTYSRSLLRVDAETGKTLRELPCPGSGVVKWAPRGPDSRPTGAHGLEFRDGRLWVAVPPAVCVFVLDPGSGAVLRSFPAPGVRPHGLGWDADGSLWCAETNYRSFFKLSPKSGAILSQRMLPPDAPEKEGFVLSPHGMAIRKGELWFSVAETGEIYRLPLR